MLLFFWLGGLCAGTSGNRTRPRRSRGAGQEKNECMGPGINTEVKRNCLGQKNQPQVAFAGLEAFGGTWGPDTVRDPQGLTLRSKGTV